MTEALYSALHSALHSAFYTTLHSGMPSSNSYNFHIPYPYLANDLSWFCWSSFHTASNLWQIISKKTNNKNTMTKSRSSTIIIIIIIIVTKIVMVKESQVKHLPYLRLSIWVYWSSALAFWQELEMLLLCRTCSYEA